MPCLMELFQSFAYFAFKRPERFRVPSHMRKAIPQCGATIAKTIFETMVLPEVSRTMAYTTRNTVNRLARKELNSNPVVLELSKEKEIYTSSSRNISSIR